MQLLAPVGASAEAIERAALLENRRRVLAVLTVLAISPRALTRDQLADFFWSDSEPARARHSVAEALRMLRRVFGADVVAARSADLEIDAAVPLEIDVQRFTHAHTAGDHETAVATYVADFLDGVYIDRAPRFEEWVARQRDTLRTMFATSCMAECRRLSLAGLHAECAALARRWLDVAPLSTEAADQWMRALVAPGTSEAIRTARERYTQYDSQLRTEFEVSPESKVTRILLDAEQALAQRTPNTALPALSPQRQSTTAAESLSASDAPTTRETPAPGPAPTHRTRVALGALTGAIVLLGATWKLGLLGDVRGGASPTPMVLVLADAEAVVSDTLLGSAVALATATALNESNVVRMVSSSRIRTLRQLTSSASDSAARRGPFTEALARAIAVRAGAGVVAVPVVVNVGDKYRVALRLVRTNNGEPIATIQSEVVERAALLTALDDVVQRARRALGDTRRSGTDTRPLPDYTTASLDALRAYAVGARDFSAQNYAGAIAAYTQAGTIDSTFALAHAALGRTLAFINRPQEADSAFARARRHEAHLSPRERVIVRAAALRARGLADSAIALRDAWLRVNPDDFDQRRTQLFDLLTRSRRAEAVVIGEQLLRQDSTDENVWMNLALAYDGEDVATRERAVATYSRGLQLDSTPRTNLLFPQLYGGLLARARMYDSASRFLTTVGAGDVRMQGRAMRALGQMELMRSRPLPAIAAFARAVASGRSTSDTLSWVRSRLWLATTYYVSGDSVGAAAQFDTLAREARLLREPPVQYWIGLQLARIGRVSDATAVLGALDRVKLPNSALHAANRALLNAEIATARGQSRTVVPTLRDAAMQDSSAISLETLAWVTLQAGDTVTARAVAKTIFDRVPGFGFEGWLARDRAMVWLRRLDATVPVQRTPARAR